MVGLGRFELPTSPLSGVRSNQLSYRPKVGRPDRRLTASRKQLQARRLYKSYSVLKGFEDKVERTQAAMPPVTIVRMVDQEKKT
jgi:hypothetical protein